MRGSWRRSRGGGRGGGGTARRRRHGCQALDMCDAGPPAQWRSPRHAQALACPGCEIGPARGCIAAAPRYMRGVPPDGPTDPQICCLQGPDRLRVCKHSSRSPSPPPRPTPARPPKNGSADGGETGLLHHRGGGGRRAPGCNGPAGFPCTTGSLPLPAASTQQRGLRPTAGPPRRGPDRQAGPGHRRQLGCAGAAGGRQPGLVFCVCLFCQLPGACVSLAGAWQCLALCSPPPRRRPPGRRPGRRDRARAGGRGLQRPAGLAQRRGGAARGRLHCSRPGGSSGGGGPRTWPHHRGAAVT